MAVNSVSLTGNLTRDPDKRGSKDKPVLSFSIAVNERRKVADGKYEDYPNFVGCVVFGNRATALAKILKKGMKVAVNGRLSYSSWEKDDEKRSKLEVVCSEIDIMSAKQSGNSDNGSDW